MTTMNVKDAAGSTVTIEKPLAPGRAAAASSRPVALSTEDLAALTAITAKLLSAPATEAKQDTLIAKDFATQTTLAALLAKVIASPSTEAKQDTMITALAGLHTDLATTLAGYVDGLEALATSLNGYVDGLEGLTGAVTETAPANDTASSGLNGRLQRIAQNQTTFFGAKVTAAAALGTGGSGVLGWLSDLSTKLLGGIVAQLGARTVSQSPAVNLATDDPMIGTKVTAITALASGGSEIIGWLSQIWDKLNSGLSLTDISAGEWETVAASATDQALGATGAAGDYLAQVLIVPATTSPGAVSIKDGAGSAITIFAGGASSLSNLAPFAVPLGMKSLSGAWKLTTGTNVSAIGIGNFT